MCFLGWLQAAREVSHENNDQHTVSLTRAEHAGYQSSPILTPYSEYCVKLQEIYCTTLLFISIISRPIVFQRALWLYKWLSIKLAPCSTEINSQRTFKNGNL